MYYRTFTRFERTRIISARALQISMGAPVLIETSEKDSYAIARQEFEAGVIPLTVKRFAGGNDGKADAD